MLALGEEKKHQEDLSEARADIKRKCAGGFPEMYYHDIRFLPAYVAAASTFQWAYVDVVTGQASTFLFARVQSTSSAIFPEGAAKRL